ncbi:MAG: glutamate--tRNA ligase [Holosporales bacterium]|jgi:glutamyl-tRNA synthetase|nr:glutamate--tRNA ligase [Holosporales bacterium]
MKNDSVVVRFAPSPTGILHIGSVRTALFNWLYAKHNGGKFLLRIEDTDRIRSTHENTILIFDVLKWMGLDYDGEAVIQSSRIDRHKEVALNLIQNGKAYYCYCSQKELEEKKNKALAEGTQYKYDRICRDGNSKRSGTSPVIRLKSEIEGSTTISDMVQGDVTVSNSQLDDMVLLRSDGSPTYMLSVVVDDHDMEITHVIRGDDHLTNTFRQIQIYKACGWNIPKFGHIPLIYGQDGAKLSKRHGAVSTVEYKDLGYLPEAIFNYLLRLGWSHGDSEIISKEEAIEWFDFNNVGKSPSRFDINKLNYINAYYMRRMNEDKLLEYMQQFMKDTIVDECSKNRMRKGLKSLKDRAETVLDLAVSSMIYVMGPEKYSEECSKYNDSFHKDLLLEFLNSLESKDEQIYEQDLLNSAKELVLKKNVKLVELAQSLRSALTGKVVSPSVFEIMEILGKSESISRIKKFVSA